jgi:hypothetical protein
MLRVENAISKAFSDAPHFWEHQPEAEAGQNEAAAARDAMWRMRMRPHLVLQIHDELLYEVCRSALIPDLSYSSCCFLSLHLLSCTLD